MALQQKSRSLMNLSQATASPRHITRKKKLMRKNCSSTSLVSIYDDDIADSLSSTDESSLCSVSVSSTIPEQNEDEEEVYGYGSLTRFPWFVGKLSRCTAEKYLKGTKNGTFLVRESEGQREYRHAIAVRWKNQSSHIRIYRRKGTFSVCTYHSDYFRSIQELVVYYQENTLGANFPFVNTTLCFPYRDLFGDKQCNEYAEDLPGSPELEPPELPPRTPSMSLVNPRTSPNLVNPNKPLQDQLWYHGKITRIQAEFLLSSKQTFSFLLRDSESESSGYSLSFRESTSGYVHLHISREGEGYIMGKFSELFNSVSECIFYYCHHKLNVKGANHGCLRHPVNR